jgi:hypothetical protein
MKYVDAYKGFLHCQLVGVKNKSFKIDAERMI